jgi:hypothetical protein
MPLKKIGTIKSSTTPRVLPAIEGRPRMEVTAVGTSGDILGIDVFGSFSTYQAEMKADGVATFSATGVGVNTEDGGSAWKGVCYFQTSAPSLSELNGMCVVFYWNVDPEGIAIWELHEFS